MPLFVWAVRIVALLAVLTVIYLALSLYNRWAERRRLAAEFDRQAGQGAAEARDKEAFLSQGMNAYERSLKPKLLLGVYLVPLAALVLLVALAQFG